MRSDGALLAFVRGPLGSPHHIGLQGCGHAPGGAHRRRRPDRRGCDQRRPRSRQVAHLMLAGLDFPEEERRLHRCGRQGSAGRSGSSSATTRSRCSARAPTVGWGVAVTCGTGINCVGIGPDGRHVRFPSLGSITGDWGGGYDLGIAALGAAARSQDGRGPVTTLERGGAGAFRSCRRRSRWPRPSTPERSPSGVSRSWRRSCSGRRTVTRSRRMLLARLTAEVAAFVRAAIVRLELGDPVPEVLLGGGLMQAANGRLVRDTASHLAEPRAGRRSSARCRRHPSSELPCSASTTSVPTAPRMRGPDASSSWRWPEQGWVAGDSEAMRRPSPTQPAASSRARADG